ncbi:STAS domain-containing protein [Nonomuraea basaltis]|uniref:STAS domain-containing protein n=1 Tax=Nonomuraea basaltis TaxID=2495887 RepID=UPI00110C5D27|nr:STAS domain-containing protein [Nonomuraea basaltis]TMR98937.1 STAS domain-containing protein [Nonomuraea basaltis]
MSILDTSSVDAGEPSTPTVVELTGEIDIFTSPTLRRRLLAALRQSTDLLILDLSRVTFCDSSGLAVLVGVQRRARSMGITVALTAPRPYMSELLRSTGLDRQFPMTA